MSRRMTILKAGPGITVQDLGRPGYLGEGLSRGGAADVLAMAEGAALLGQAPGCAALEIAGSWLEVSFDAPVWVALTGAVMAAKLDGEALVWNAAHPVGAGQRLALGPVRAGVFSYLHVDGGIACEPLLGSRSTHLTAGIGAALAGGDTLPLFDATGGESFACALPADTRLTGGEIRVMEGPQTRLFPEETRERFAATPFTRAARGNRQGVALDYPGDGFRAEGQLSLLSDIVTPGDIQITGDGLPYVLGPECQTTGGYPRIGTVLPADLPKVMQAAPHTALRFRFVSLAEARASYQGIETQVAALARKRMPLIRDPHTIRDLLSYQLVGGVTAGRELSDG